MIKRLYTSIFTGILLSGFLLTAAEELKTLDAISKDAKSPAKVNKRLMSKDKTYGYSDQNPILVGSREEYGGPVAEETYLKSLLDAQGQPIQFKRLFSGGNSPDGKPLDCYEITVSSGEKVRLWINMYYPKNKPEKQPAPVGFYKKRG